MQRPSTALFIALCLGAATAALGEGPVQAESQGSSKLFPKGWVRGYTEFGVAPPHNEPDLNRCSAGAGAPTYGGLNAPCTAFARFIGSGYVELQPLNTTVFRRVFLFAEPRVFFGRNLPQALYTYSARPMAFDRSVGIGVELVRNIELRLTQHQVDWVGRYQNYLGGADMGKKGPLGVYTTVSARWYFGGYKGRR